jgi:hypothetical protein
MLSIQSGRSPSRRDVLRIGTLGLTGLSLASMLEARSMGAAAKTEFTSGKSVIFLMQQGGPTQFETFDPKLDVPDGIRTVGGVSKTATPGVTFGSALPRLAKLADRMAIVRSFTTGNGGHNVEPVVGPKTFGANVGSLYARMVGANHPVTGMPTNVLLDPHALGGDLTGAMVQSDKFSSAGQLGKSYSPFMPGGGGDLQKNMRLKLSEDRLSDRRALLSSLDRLRAELDRSGAMEGVSKFREQAYDVILKGVADAFDLAKEEKRTLERYDTSQFLNEQDYTDKTNGRAPRRRYQYHAQSLGHLLLLARRLCEAGCGFVTITSQFVWDMHADGNNLDVERGMDAVIRPYDHAVSAFIEDCKERGISDDIVLVSTGEMGRTPKINARGGRDHWGRLTPLMLSGGGFTRGQVIGQSTRDGGEPDTEAITTDNLISTIMHSLFDVGQLRITQGLPTDLVRFISSGTPINGLV